MNPARNGRELSIATFNLYNLFEHPDDRDAVAVKLAKLALALQYELYLPDILCLQEVGSEALLLQLTKRVNAAARTQYQAVAPACSDLRGIRLGLMWDADRVQLSQAYQLSGTAVATAFGPDSSNPGREPLVAGFVHAGTPLTVVNNHFKSDYLGDAPPIDHPRLLREFRLQRGVQAQVVRDFVDGRLAGDPDALILIAGDFNDTHHGDDSPLRVLEGGPDTARFTNLLPAVRERQPYSFIKDGQRLLLDHMLASPALLARLTAVQVYHFNAAFPEDFESDSTTAVRVSDHDPLAARFRLPSDDI